MRGLAVILLVLVATSQASAELGQQFRKCAVIDNSVQRLACFDRLAKENAPKPKPAVATGFTGSWSSQSEVSKRDDRANVFVYVQSSNVVRRSAWRGRVSLMFACREGKTSAWAAYPFFLTTNRTKVVYRIDRAKPRTVWLSVSTDNKAFGWWYASLAIPMAKSLFGKSKLLVWTVPYGESEVLAEFDVRGLENAIKPLRKACNW